MLSQRFFFFFFFLLPSLTVKPPETRRMTVTLVQRRAGTDRSKPGGGESFIVYWDWKKRLPEWRNYTYIIEAESCFCLKTTYLVSCQRTCRHTECSIEASDSETRRSLHITSHHFNQINQSRSRSLPASQIIRSVLYNYLALIKDSLGISDYKARYDKMVNNRRGKKVGERGCGLGWDMNWGISRKN